MLLQSSFHLLYAYLRPLLKWLLHRFTGLCELQRICYGTAVGARRTHRVEHSLRLSRHQRIRQLLIGLEARIVQPQLDIKPLVVAAVQTVLRAKRINARYHPELGPNLGGCLAAVWGYRRLYHAVEALRCTSYDAASVEHERKLLLLWRLLCPDEPLEARITKQWQDIGFQGDDPKTDFRGMGMLGLDNLLFFAQEMTVAARHLLSHSRHPRYGYTFAIVGINLTSMAYKMLKSGVAKNHYYNRTVLVRRPADADVLDAFHMFYCYLMVEFDRFWLECKPNSIMEFSAISERFEADVKKRLADDAVCLRIDLAMEDTHSLVM